MGRRRDGNDQRGRDVHLLPAQQSRRALSSASDPNRPRRRIHASRTARMTSLRSRLIAWYVGVAAVTVLLIGLLTSIVFAKLVSFDVSQTLQKAGGHIMPLILQYASLPPDERPDLQSYLQAHLSNLGVLVALAPPEPPQFLQLQSRAIAPAIGSPKMFGSPLRPPLFVRLLAFEVHPVSVAFPGGTALLFADPARLRSTMVQLWTIVILFAALLMAIAWRIAIVVADNT